MDPRWTSLIWHLLLLLLLFKALISHLFVASYSQQFDSFIATSLHFRFHSQGASALRFSDFLYLKLTHQPLVHNAGVLNILKEWHKSYYLSRKRGPVNTRGCYVRAFKHHRDPAVINSSSLLCPLAITSSSQTIATEPHLQLRCSAGLCYSLISLST